MDALTSLGPALEQKPPQTLRIRRDHMALLDHLSRCGLLELIAEIGFADLGLLISKSGGKAPAKPEAIQSARRA